MPHQTILGIETSCDETAAAVYQSGIRSSVLFSQSEMHKEFGGVVPEVASRAQIEKITPIIAQALKQANKTLNQIDVIAVTSKPGLPGSLLVGVCFAKALAFAANKKLIGINHLEGHVYSACIENNIPFPFLCLTASGGHTSLYLVKSFYDYEILGTTLNDAAGEAFDKVSKMLDLGYPGGPTIEKLAQEVDFKDFFNYPRMKKKNLNFSFSGLKTAVLYDLVEQGAYDLKQKMFLTPHNQKLKQQVASSLLVCMKDIFVDRIKLAFKEHPEIKALSFVGGVACNKYLREQFLLLAKKYKIPFFTPTPQYCTDNAAMIAFVGSKKAEKNMFDELDLDIY
jgi:N6-L-threonylcarbamoyladenine synthase